MTIKEDGHPIQTFYAIDTSNLCILQTKPSSLAVTFLPLDTMQARSFLMRLERHNFVEVLHARTLLLLPEFEFEFELVCMYA